MGRKRRSATISEIKRLQRMAAIGTVSLADADKALGRPQGFSRYWAIMLGLRFAAGRTPIAQRLLFHRKS